MKVVWVSVESEEYQSRGALDVVRGETKELLLSLASMKDDQAGFQILRQSAATRLHFLLRTLPPQVVKEAAAEFDQLMEWTLASIITDLDNRPDTLASPPEVRENAGECRNQ